MSVYYDVLTTALAAAAALPAFNAPDAGGTGRGYRKSLHKAPAWDGGLHAWPQLLAAPREDLAEQLLDEHMAGKVVLGLDVYLGLFLPRDNTRETLRERLGRREDLRLAMYRPGLLGGVVAGQYDVRFDPAPAVQRTWPDTLDADWLLFTFLVEARRN